MRELHKRIGLPHEVKDHEKEFFLLFSKSDLKMMDCILAKAERNTLRLYEMRILQPISGTLKTGV